MSFDKRPNPWSGEDIIVRISEEGSGDGCRFHFEVFGGVGHGKRLTKDVDPVALGEKLKELLDLLQHNILSDSPEADSKRRRECLLDIKRLTIPEKSILATANQPGDKLKRLVLRVSGALASRVPWEGLEYPCLACLSCWQHYLNRPECADCGGPLVRVDRVLAAAPGVVHLPSASGSTGTDGVEFLSLIDPGNEIAEAAKDGADELIKEAHKRLGDALDHFGYVELRPEPKELNRKTVLAMLRKRSIVGIYYFGHAVIDKERGAYLKLGNERLYADELRQSGPYAPFIFLNACNAAAGADSLAEAFSSLHSVVIAPVTRVSALESALFAARFFEKLASATSVDSSVASVWWELGQEAAQHTVHSLHGIYRIFGCKTAQIPARIPAPRIELFSRDEEHLLIEEALSDNLRAVLVAARRATDGPIGVSEIIRALEQKGNVTRHLVNQLLLSTTSERASVPPDRWLRTARSDLDTTLITCLLAAAETAAAKHEKTVSERDLLRQLIPLWYVELDLEPSLLERSLRDMFEGSPSAVDSDGNIELGALTETARRVVLTVYEQFGEITGPTLFSQLVAFAGSDGCAGARPRFEAKSDAPTTLAADSKRVSIPMNRDRNALIPMLQRARARGQNEIDHHHLLTLLRETSTSTTRDAIQHKWRTDLEALGCACRGTRTEGKLDLDRVSQTKIDSCAPCAQDVIRRYHYLTRVHKSCSNRLLLAAFLDQNREHTADPLQSLPELDRKTLSEQLIAASKADDEQAWIEDDQTRWQARINALIEKLPEGATSTVLLKQFGQTLPDKFREGIKNVLGKEWPKLKLTWIA